MKNLLREVPVFGGLDEKQLKVILDLARVEKYRKGDIIYRQGETATDIYIIRKGRVSACITEEYEKCLMPLGFFGEGDCFGEMAIIEVAPHHGTARAEEETELICLSISALFRLYEEEPRLFALIILNTARELSRRLDKADKKLIHYYYRLKKRKTDPPK